MRALFALLLLGACGGDVKAPVPIGFSGTCKLSVPRDTSGFVHTFLSADELKSHVKLRIVRDSIMAIHVEIPDNRHTAFEDAPDHPLLTGDAAPQAVVDRGGDVDIPMQLHGEGRETWDLAIRVRFRDDKAEVVAGNMVVSGPCVIDKP